MFRFRMLVLSVVALSGCVSQAAYVVPKVELPATVSEVVTAQSTALQNERAAADVSRRQLEAAVRLIKAAGGPVADG
jgi:outer membrane protein TolC